MNTSVFILQNYLCNTPFMSVKPCVRTGAISPVSCFGPIVGQLIRLCDTSTTNEPIKLNCQDSLLLKCYIKQVQ